MIMARDDDDGRQSSPPAKHPWSHPWKRNQADKVSEEPRLQKVSMAVTRTEFLALRSRAGSMTISQFLRANFPAELLLPQRPDEER